MKVNYSISSCRSLSAFLLFIFASTGLPLLIGCRTAVIGHTQAANMDAPPAGIQAVFAHAKDNTIVLSAIDPGQNYKSETSEKATGYAIDKDLLRYKKISMTLHPKMPAGTVLVDMRFVDGKGNAIHLPTVDLLRLTPKVQLDGPLQYPELLLAEYERFGISFRREHDEFELVPGPESDGEFDRLTTGCHRFVVWNNCLDPGKWEVVLFAEDFSDFSRRRKGSNYLNQERTLAHSWFYMDHDLYEALLRLKNPNLKVPLDLDYKELTARAEMVKVDFSALRELGEPVPAEILEIGHKTKRPLEPLTKEQHYKWEFGLVLGKEKINNYHDILQGRVALARFHREGFYNPWLPKIFDYRWLQAMDRVNIHSVVVQDSDCYVQLVFSGKDCPYEITIGNIDVALLSEQELYGLPFGFNPYPKVRRHNAHPDTIHYESDRMPAEKRPFIVMTDSAKHTWINNQDRGLEKVYLGWDGIERDVLLVYFVSYERITPVWMARIRLNDAIVDRARIRRQLYTY